MLSPLVRILDPSLYVPTNTHVHTGKESPHQNHKYKLFLEKPPLTCMDYQFKMLTNLWNSIISLIISQPYFPSLSNNTSLMWKQVDATPKTSVYMAWAVSLTLSIHTIKHWNTKMSTYQLTAAWIGCQIPHTNIAILVPWYQLGLQNHENWNEEST